MIFLNRTSPAKSAPSIPHTNLTQNLTHHETASSKSPFPQGLSLLPSSITINHSSLLHSRRPEGEKMILARLVFRSQLRPFVSIDNWYTRASPEAKRTIQEGSKNYWNRDEIMVVYDSPVPDLLFYGVTSPFLSLSLNEIELFDNKSISEIESAATNFSDRNESDPSFLVRIMHYRHHDI